LDGYLLRFERTCEAYEVKRELWSITLATHLNGKALEVYQRLSTSEAKSYDRLKSCLLKRFQLTEGGYRKKFKESRMEVGETPTQFIERLRRYIQQWIEMAGYDQTYEGLETMIIRDQFFNMCPADMRVFLKERGKTTCKEMLEHAEAFIDAHGLKQHEASMKPNFKFQDRGPNKVFEDKAKEKFASNVNRGRADERPHKPLNFNKFNNQDYNRERGHVWNDR
jgi:hypothetical protein